MGDGKFGFLHDGILEQNHKGAVNVLKERAGGRFDVPNHMKSVQSLRADGSALAAERSVR